MSLEQERKDLVICDSIEYRKGVIEVTRNIHENCVNIETWQVHSDTDLTAVTKGQFDLEDKIQANTELELSKAAALQLIEQLKTAIGQLR